MLPIDPLTSLALSIQANPGVYALLVGSGISRAASIPTGWEVTVDLIKQLAASEGEDAGESPAEWFKKKYDKDPDYSDLLDELYDPATRQAKLRRYFEPDETEREEGKKLPTQGHKGIARLVRGGYIRVIITTNFDHLVEDAIRDEGIEPVIISTSDGINGAIPLTHSQCTVIKVHGDYLDTRIKNTKPELAQYDPTMNVLLDRILDEYGLIVSGWSSEYDPALRQAIDRTANHRYSIFWTSRGQPTGTAAKLISARKARVILVKDADQLFDTLAEKVQAAEDSVRPHPADSATFIAQVKRYIPEDRHRIRLCDFLREEASQTLRRLVKIDAEQLFAGRNFIREVERREDASEKLLRALAQYGLHGNGDCGRELRFLIEVIADDHFPNPSQRKDHGLILYPAVVAIYIASIAALSNNRDAITAEVLNARGLLDQQRGKTLDLFARSQLGKHLDQSGVPSDLRLGVFLRERCKPFLSAMFSTEEAFDWAFDRFEYISALAMRIGTEHGYIIPGLWVRNLAWRRLQNRDDLLTVVSREIEEQGDNWPYLKHGLFKGRHELLTAKKEFDEGFRKYALSKFA